MEAKNIQIIRRTLSILRALECPLLAASDLAPSLNQDEQLFFSEENSKEYSELRQFIQPGQQRLSLFLWLIEIFDSSILESAQGTKQVEKIEQGLRLLGLLPWHTIYQNIKSIQGFNGLSASLQLLYKTSELVFQDTLKGCQSASSLLNEIAQNSSKIFPSKARLYPPDFPSSLQIEKAATLSQLSQALRDWTKVKEQTKQELDQLLEGYYIQNQELVKYDTLVSLKQSLLHLRQRATQLICAINSMPNVGKLKKAQNSITKLSPLIEKCSHLNNQVDQTVSSSESLISNIHLIMAGSNTSLKMPTSEEIRQIQQQIDILDTLSQIH